MSKGIIIQARYSATRLPGKLLLPFYENNTILDVIISNIKEYAEIRRIPVILATTQNIADDSIVRYCEKYKFLKIFRGSEENVLNRFIQAAKKFNITEIIRVCADNPFINIQYADDYFKIIENNNYDYISYFINSDFPVIKSHFGFWPEYVKLHALEKTSNDFIKQKHKEHVTVFLYENPDKFKIGKLYVNQNIAQNLNIRLTVDTISDFNLVRQIYSEMKTKNNIFSPEKIVNEIIKNQDFISKMIKNINENMK